MDIGSIIVSQGFILGVSGLLGGAWRAADWYLNHKDEYEDVKRLYIIRNIGIGAFFGLNTQNINVLVGNLLSVNIPVVAPIAFMYGMCGELILVSLYETIKSKIQEILSKIQ